MNRKRNAKIVATLGPASNTKETIQALFEAGADVFRLNFSHGEHADHAMRFKWIREVESQLNYPLGILMDLQGPKLRVGRLAEGKVQLQRGQSLRLAIKNLGDKRYHEHLAEGLPGLEPYAPGRSLRIGWEGQF